MGTPIDLDGPEAKLNARLVSLVRRENHLDERGITCAVKDRADTSCHACPMSQHEATDSDLGMLCRLGREQEQVVTTIAVMAWSK